MTGIRYNCVWQIGAALVSVLFLAGCGAGSGPERAEVRGKVTFKGQPVEDGTIAFIPTGETTGPSAGGKIENGEYVIPAESGPVVGTHRVEIRAMRKTGKQTAGGIPGESSGPSGDPTPVAQMEQFIPPEYNAKSKLTTEVKPGLNENVDFEL